MEWNTLLQAAEKLQLDLDQMKVKKLQEISENGQYYLTFWGHYSAGKSRLINNLLGKDILPVQVRETTAVMTYIRYGREEHANIYYEDGRASTVALEDIRRIYQNSENIEGGPVEEIDHMEVFIDSPLLEGGLVIVDTPGVNTVITKHQELAVSVIELSRKIVYVLGGALTKADEQFIRQIRDSGIEMLFVRTKCDLLNADEENPVESMKKEEGDLKALYGEEAVVHFVSNLPEKKEWHERLKFLREDLHKITDNLQEEFARSFLQQKKLYAEKFSNLLQEHLTELGQIYEGERSKVEMKLEEEENKIQSLEEIMKRQNSQFDQRISGLKLEVKNELPLLLQQLTESFREKMEGIVYSEEGMKTVEAIYQDEMEKAIGKLQRFFQVRFDEFITLEEKPLHEILDEEDYGLSETPSYREMEQQNAMVLRQYAEKMEHVRASLLQLQKEKEESSGELEMLETSLARRNYEEEIREIEAYMNAIPKEIAMVVSEDQPLQPSEILRNAGKAVDLALLLIPGKAIAAGVQSVAKTAKVAKVLKNSGKVGEVIKVVVNSTEAIQKIDTVRDRTYALKNAISQGKKMSNKKAAEKLVNVASRQAESTYDMYRNTKKNKDGSKHGVLDMLEVAYWAEKVGKNFDKPLKMEVDVEEERQKKEYRDELYQKKTAVLDEYNKKRREYNRSLSRQEELEREEEDKKRILQEIEKETEKKAEQLLRQANEKVLEDYKKQYRSYFEKNLRTLKEKMTESYFQGLADNTVFHMAQLNEKISADLEREKARLEILLKERADKESITMEMDGIRQLMSTLA